MLLYKKLLLMSFGTTYVYCIVVIAEICSLGPKRSVAVLWISCPSASRMEHLRSHFALKTETIMTTEISSMQPTYTL